MDFGEIKKKLLSMRALFLMVECSLKEKSVGSCIMLHYRRFATNL